MPATPYTELSATATPFFEGIGVPMDDALAMLGLVIPVSDGLMFFDPNVAYTELTGVAFSGTELTASATAFTELVL